MEGERLFVPVLFEPGAEGALFQQSNSQRGLGETSLLQDSTRGKEYPLECENRLGAFWPGPDVRSDLFT